jgi:hypothetical protein
MAFMAANPAMVMGVTVASAPPANIMSASPCRMWRAALPIACADVAQAETVA